MKPFATATGSATKMAEMFDTSKKTIAGSYKNQRMGIDFRWRMSGTVPVAQERQLPTFSDRMLR